jgi:hypothetical protein
MFTSAFPISYLYLTMLYQLITIFTTEYTMLIGDEDEMKWKYAPYKDYSNRENEQKNEILRQVIR